MPSGAAISGPKLRLGYWACRGLGETIRLILEYTGLPYEDCKYQFEGGRDKFEKEKKETHMDFPNLPYLRTFNGSFVSEQQAIIFWICKTACTHDNVPNLLGQKPS